MNETPLASWAIAYLRRQAALIQSSLPQEPQTEPERAFWHLQWNSLVDTIPFDAGAAYAAEHGREAPAELLPLLLRMSPAFHTNPYPGEMVLDRTRRALETHGGAQ